MDIRKLPFAPRDRRYDFDTLAVREAQIVDCADVQCELLALSNSYRFDEPLDAELKFSGSRKGHVYSRISNPTVNAFERRFAALEGADEGVAFASGMAAIDALFGVHLKPGAHAVCARDVFGTTSYLLENYYRPIGVEIDFVDVRSLSEWQDSIRENTRVLFLETPTNPTLRIADIQALAALPRPDECILIVDNTLATPVIQRPLELGADAVVHSAGKYADGQGRVMGGLVATSHAHAEPLRASLRNRGSCLSPFNAWHLLKSLETLTIRMRAHSERARGITSWLNRCPHVRQVNYPGGKNYAQTALAARQHQIDGSHGGLLSFVVRGSKEIAWALMSRLELITMSTNIGDSKSLVTHPASTTHARMSKEQRAKADIGDSLLRISVGLEAEADLIEDIANAFDLVFEGKACSIPKVKSWAVV